ncbi:hypothetical protein As57867_007021, partial [Aphanomyces stellatus]
MGDAITVGSPVPNVTSYVLDKFHQQVPVGVVGEMYLGGVCVSSGYINLPEQNIERFVPNPFSANTSRMFRTGDLCRLLPSGQFEILGRLDSQVKLKGYRIELEEVAEAMTQHPGITTAAVIVKDNCYLVGYFTPANVNVHELERSVADHLPTYMVPSVWVGLEAMPLNTNGKIDKIVLQELDVAHEVQVLQSEAEHKMAEVWSEVLNVALSVIGRRTSFLALGGDSITAIRLVAKAKQMGFSLTSAAVMKHTTLEAMTHIAKHIHVQDTSECYAVVSGDVSLTPIQCVNFSHIWNNPHFWNLSMTQKPRRHLALNELKMAVARLVEHHDSLRTRFRYDAQDGWSQYILETTVAALPNVDFVQIRNIDALEAAVMEKEKSLNLVNGPVYAVTVFETEDNNQYLQFTLHHAIVDLVSWRILLDDLQIALKNEAFAPKTMSFKEWSEHLTAQAQVWQASAWDEYMADDIVPPADESMNSIHEHEFILSEKIASKVDSANATYGTNIQELALAALTEAIADIRSSAHSLNLMMEGHGREPWDANMDVSSTVGWFTSLFPVVFNASGDVSTTLRQVKQKLRAVPNKGLSYGAIKYLAPDSTETNRVKTHR